MRQFFYEVDATDVTVAIAATAEKVGTVEAEAVADGGKTVLMMNRLPDPGKADSLKRNLSKAYRLASSVGYGVPSQGDAGATWNVTETDGTGDDAMRPFCVAIDCGIPSWDVITYRKVPRTKATARFHLRYVVEADGEPIGDFEKVSEAKELARMAMDDPAGVGLVAHPEDVAIRRKPVSDGGSDLATMYQRKVRMSKTRPMKTPVGASVVAKHHWFVYGSVPNGGTDSMDILDKTMKVRDKTTATR